MCGENCMNTSNSGKGCGPQFKAKIRIKNAVDDEVVLVLWWHVKYAQDSYVASYMKTRIICDHNIRNLGGGGTGGMCPPNIFGH